MTVKERFERIEHVTAALVDERRKDREEYRQLWRETNQTITRLAEESRAADKRLEEKIDRLAQELRDFASEARDADKRLREDFREADRELQARIESMVSASGKFLAGK